MQQHPRLERSNVHSLFGIELQSDLDLPGRHPRPSVGGPTVRLQRADLGEPPTAISWRTRLDGRDLVVRRDGRGRVAISWGTDCRFMFEAQSGILRWTASDPTDSSWQRVLLDTVAYLVALELGLEALHAAAVVIDGSAIAIAARSGHGKSTLACALLTGGAELLSDDIVAVEPRGEGVLAHPGPPLMNVPAARPLPEREVIRAFGDELWTEVPVVEGPQSLQALVLLERRSGATERLERLSPSLMLVLPHLLAHPRTPERERRRFELAGRLADAVPVHRLVADTATPPERLCELLGHRVLMEDRHA